MPFIKRWPVKLDRALLERTPRRFTKLSLMKLDEIAATGLSGWGIGVLVFLVRHPCEAEGLFKLGAVVWMVRGNQR